MAVAVKSIEKWQELGHQLNVHPDKLSELLNSGNSVAECRDEVIAYWEKHDEDASWEKLGHALSRMGENQLADRIIDEHVKKINVHSLTDKHISLVSPSSSDGERDNLDN